MFLIYQYNNGNIMIYESLFLKTSKIKSIRFSAKYLCFTE